MSEISYLDFDLTFTPSEDGYHVAVDGPAGRSTGDFRLPFNPLELENLLLKIGGRREPVRRVYSPAMEAATTFGTRLFNAVFTGEILGCFRASLAQATKEEAGLRIRLHLIETPLLLDLPWEYLYDPILATFPARSTWTPIVRYLDLPMPVQPLAVEPPLKILVMISSPLDYEPKLDVEREWANLQAALAPLERRGLVRMDRLECATLDTLRQRLQTEDYNVFHFIGHGGFDQRTQDSVVVLEDGTGKGRWVSGQSLGEMLRDERKLRLVLLNACEGARASSTDPFAGTAQTLVRQGIPAVIAMQFEVSDQAAITFAQEFYRALALSYPVDGAVAEARRAILALGNELEWGTPVLYLQAPDGRIFHVEGITPEKFERSPNEKRTKKPTPERRPKWASMRPWIVGVIAVTALVIGALWLRGFLIGNRGQGSAIMVSPCAEAEDNLVLNGGFEQELDHWGTGYYETDAYRGKLGTFWASRLGDEIADVRGDVDSEVHHCGAKSFKITNNQTFMPNLYGSMSQRITGLLPNTDYLAAVWVKAERAGKRTLEITTDLEWKGRLTIEPGTYGWRRYTQVFNTGDSTYVDFRILSEDPGTVWIDDLSFTRHFPNK